MTLSVRRSAMPVLGAGLGVVFGLATVSSAAVTLAPGEDINLEELMNSNDKSFIVGDKLFTVINFSSVDFFAADVTLVAYENQNPLAGRGFELHAGWHDEPGDDHTADFVFRYTVEILPEFYAQGFRIVDNVLTFNGGTSDTLGAFIRVDETVLDFDGPKEESFIGQKSVYSRYTKDGRDEDFQDSLNFSPRRKLDIVKDVQLFAPTAGSQANISFVRQSFSQIPSPATLSLIALGGCLVARRRR